MCVGVSVCVCVCVRARVLKSTLALTLHLAMTDAHPQNEVAMKHYRHDASDIQYLTYSRHLTKVISPSFALSRLDDSLQEGEDCECLTVSVLVPNTIPSPRSYQIDTSLRILVFKYLECQYSR